MEAGLHRSTRIALRATKARRRRLYGLLRSAGDVRALGLDCNRQPREWRMAPFVSYQALCREIAGMAFGELDTVGARSVIKRYSTEWFEADKARKAGVEAGLPRRNRALLSVRWHHARHFRIDGDRLRVPVARGWPPLAVHLAREVPHPAESIRSVTLLAEAGRLYVDVTAALHPEDHDPGPGVVAGVDPGIIHPFAVVSGDEALLLSGRAMRAECHLHLADTKARATKMGRKVPKKSQRGSRRYAKLRRPQRRQEARHRRRIRQAHHEAAKAGVSWAIEHRVGIFRVGDPAGICKHDAGRRQNLALRNGGLPRPARTAGAGPPSPGGGPFVVRSAASAATAMSSGPPTSPPPLRIQGGGVICGDPRIEHRRVGDVPARRDRRRHRHDQRRSCLAHGRRKPKGSRSRSKKAAERRASPSVDRTRAGSPAIGEDLPTSVSTQEGKGW